MPLIPSQQPPYYETGSAITIKQYIALLTQIGTAAPTVTILKNTLGAPIVWTYNDVGNYTGTLIGAFTTNTIILYALNGTGNIYVQHEDEDVLGMGTTDIVGAPENGLLNKSAINITIYP